MQLSQLMQSNLLGGEILAALSCVDPSVRVADFFSQADFARRADAKLKLAHEILEDCRAIGASLTFPGDAAYPREFLNLERPPLFLSYFGQPVWLKRSRLAIVGSREPHPRTLEWMDQHLTPLLRKREITVISGAARGVDSRAHLLSVRAARPTIAFMPSGLAKLYPSQFSEMKSAILSGGGAIMSEYQPQEPMRKFHFLQRNRLIASLAPVVFVAEANRRSGSMVTARLAQLGQSRICVLPSFPGDGAGSGTLELLIEGATPIRDADDLISVCDLEMSGEAR